MAGQETRQDFFSQGQEQGDETGFFFAEPASLETRQDFYFAAQGPAIGNSLRIPSGVEAILVKSGQQETRQDFYLGRRQIKILSRLNRGGSMLPGDETGFFFAGPPNFL